MLIISKEDWAKIILYGKSTFPNESCGLIAGILEGKNRYVKQVYFLTNIHESSSRFSMDPKEQIKAAKDMREKGLLLLGNFHSHPKSPAVPSNEDVRLAYDHSLVYLIISFLDMEKPDLKAYRIEDNQNIIAETIMVT